MIRNISVGIDIGTATTRVVVAEFLKGEKIPRVIGTGSSSTKGVRHGYVNKFEDAVKSLKRALSEAENTSGVKIKRAFVSIGGITLSSEVGIGTAIISKADTEVTALDVNKAIKESEKSLDQGNQGNKKIIHIFPISYKLDDKPVHGNRPEGHHGIKLEVKTLFVTCLPQHYENLIGVVIEAGVEPLEVIASPLASSEIALSEKQKMVGCALVNIGAETTAMMVFEDGGPISLQVFNIGSTDITNDIALGLKIPLEEAESLKIIGEVEKSSRKKLSEIIEARLTDVFELIENHLKKIKRNGLLPAGIIFIGGGSALPALENLAKETLKLPCKIGASEMFGNTKTKLRDPAWFTALGLCFSGQNGSGYSSRGSFGGFMKDVKSSLKSMFRQLLP